MKKIGIIAIILGAFIVLGSVGQSDFETLVLLKEETPFWQIQLHCLAGFALIGLGSILITRIIRKEACHDYHRN